MELKYNAIKHILSTDYDDTFKLDYIKILMMDNNKVDENYNINCVNCVGCKLCITCSNCTNCITCINSNNCISCNKCKYCNICFNCDNCNGCNNCVRCNLCDSCNVCDSLYEINNMRLNNVIKSLKHNVDSSNSNSDSEEVMAKKVIRNIKKM